MTLGKTIDATISMPFSHARQPMQPMQRVQFPPTSSASRSTPREEVGIQLRDHVVTIVDDADPMLDHEQRKGHPVDESDPLVDPLDVVAGLGAKRRRCNEDPLFAPARPPDCRRTSDLGRPTGPSHFFACT